MTSWLQAFIPKLLGRAHVTAYVTGNIGVDAAANLARRVQSLLADQLKTQAPFPSQVPNLLKLLLKFYNLRNQRVRCACIPDVAGDLVT
jgi:secreted Zn-dependent insulinase-like peptidase